ncbi:MAG: polymer-forming cytoskeletal protein [Ghiorsea sp.]
MFGKKEKQERKVKEPQHIDTLIGAHSVFTGELSFEGAVRIDGRFEGNIHSEKDGTLIVSEGAHIKGEVNVPNLVLHGDINGNVYAGNNLIIGHNGVLNGDVQYKIITLAEGSAINGRCSRLTEKQAPENKEKLVKKGNTEAIQV